jgi:hypothetical protein
MSETEHTPTPYGMIPQPGHLGYFQIIKASDGLILAELLTEATAAFIVLACNNFDQLLVACKESRKRLKELADYYEVRDNNNIWLQGLEAAIAAAEKEQK